MVGERNIELFLKHVRLECKRYSINLRIVPGEHLTGDDGSIYGGYFQEDPLEIAVANRSDQTLYLHVLVHEFSHFEQWRDREPIYYCKYRNTSADSIVNRWIAGENFAESTLDNCIAIVRDMELNCERRSIQNIIKYKLPIDIERYARCASAYVHFYNYMRISRRWNCKDNKSIYSISDIISRMPSNMDGDYSNMSDELLRIYTQNL
jgi:hypothetical protein